MTVKSPNDADRCSRCGGALVQSSSGLFCPRCLGRIAFGERLEAQPGLPVSLGTLKYFGNYELLEEIGRGGMGVVYRARQVNLDREVAVKLMLQGVLASVADVDRFQTEARHAAALKHPQIIAIHEVGEWEGQQYYSMDLVVGQSLDQATRLGPLGARRAATLLVEIAGAVQHAHEHGILHRDLKPSNVIVDAAGHAHVTDFGLARNLQAGSTVTADGHALGTPGFMAPEQAAGHGRAVGVASDVYALGALLYQLVTGRPPFTGENIAEVLRQVAESEPVMPRLLNPEVPRDLETISLKCLAKDPGARYLTAAALGDDLDRFLQGKPIQARPISSVARVWRWARRKPTVASLAAAVVTLLIVVAIGSTLIAARLERARRQEAALREESEMRLHQGEKLIEFMLGDLVNRLEPLGQLDVLDSTVTEVKKFYSEVEPKGTTPAGERIRAKAMREMGNIRFSQGHFAEAYVNYNQSLAAYRDLTARYPENLQWQCELALVLNDLGVAYGLQSNFDNCTPALEEGLKIFQMLLSTEPQSVLYLTWIGSIAQNLVLECIYSGNYGNAARIDELLRIAEDAERKCAAIEPAVSKHKKLLAIVLGTRGDYLTKTDRIDEALVAYDGKLRILSDLVMQEPKNRIFRFDLAFALSQPAQIDIDHGRYRDAREALQRAAGLLDQMIAEDASNRDWQVIRINVLTNLGISFYGERNVSEARANFQRVWDLSREHPEMLTAYPRWAADCRLTADKAGRMLLELATAARSAGRVDEATEKEQQAAEWQTWANTLPSAHP